MQKRFVFRITARDSKVRELELNMSQGNYSYLETAEVHVVANYLKRVLRQMSEPLIQQAQFAQFAELSACTSNDETYSRIRREI